MCDDCTEHGTENRCVGCRPKRTAEERRERRLNAVKRSECVWCEACGYEGPAYLMPVKPDRGDLMAMLYVTFFSLGLGLVLVLVQVVRGFTERRCPVCETNTDLWPSKAVAGTPDALLAARAKPRGGWFELRAGAFIVVVGLLLLGSLLFAAFLNLLIDTGRPEFD